MGQLEDLTEYHKTWLEKGFITPSDLAGFDVSGYIAQNPNRSYDDVSDRWTKIKMSDGENKVTFPKDPEDECPYWGDLRGKEFVWDSRLSIFIHEVVGLNKSAPSYCINTKSWIVFEFGPSSRQTRPKNLSVRDLSYKLETYQND